MNLGFLLALSITMIKKIFKIFFINPNLIFFLKKNFYFVLPGILNKKMFYMYSSFENYVGKKYFLFPIGGKVIAFSTGPLNDNRGIGRVTRNLYQQFSDLIDFKEEMKKLTDEKRKKFKKYDLSCVDIYFFSSIHWCKNPIPNNSVVMIMDVTPLVLGDYFPKIVVQNWKKNFKTIAKKCKHIVTISDSSARDIAKCLEIESKKISVIFPGLEKIKAIKDVKIKFTSTPFLLFLGSNDFHKNAEIVIKALTTPKLQDLNIVFIGENKELKATCKDFKITHRAFFLGRLEDQEIAYVMSKASVLVFPSLYEGFGLPPLEAALHGVPSVCSKKPAMTEILDKSALFADPSNFLEWSEQIYKLINEPELRVQIIQNATAKANKLSWEDSSRKLLQLLSSI